MACEIEKHLIARRNLGIEFGKLLVHFTAGEVFASNNVEAQS